MSDVHNAPFFQVPQTSASTPYGVVMDPTMYYDASMLMALFTTDYKRAARNLTGMDLTPGLLWRGKAVIVIAFYEYRDTSVGSYNEVGLAIPVLPVHQSLAWGGWLELWNNVKTRHLGYYILNLPVTTEIACYGGREFFGLPKFVTEIPFHLDSHTFRGNVLDPNRRDLIASLSGKLGSAIRVPPMDLVLYSELNGKKMRTMVNVRGSVRIRTKGDLRLCIGNSNHEMVHNLHDLDLQDQRPFLVMETHRFQARLNRALEFDWTRK